MTPEELVTAHFDRAVDVAAKLCWLYKVSGSLAYQEEAASEALLALTRCANKFKPEKQILQQQKNQALQDEALWALMLGTRPPQYHPEDPYRNFWICSVKRIRGAVLDFFRSEKLIIKRSLHAELEKLSSLELDRIRKRLWAKEDVDQVAAEFGIDPAALKQLEPTMLHQERFLSINKPIGDEFNDRGGGDTFGDLLPSPLRTDAGDDLRCTRLEIAIMKAGAGLSAQESKAIELFYHECGYTKSEAAVMMGVTQAALQALVNSAIAKLRATRERPRPIPEDPSQTSQHRMLPKKTEQYVLASGPGV